MTFRSFASYSFSTSFLFSFLTIPYGLAFFLLLFHLHDPSSHFFFILLFLTFNRHHLTAMHFFYICIHLFDKFHDMGPNIQSRKVGLNDLYRV